MKCDSSFVKFFFSVSYVITSLPSLQLQSSSTQYEAWLPSTSHFIVQLHGGPCLGGRFNIPWKLFNSHEVSKLCG